VSTQQSFQVAGVDGCKAGWFIVIASTEKTCLTTVKKSSPIKTCCILKLEKFLVANTFTMVLSETRKCELICVDIPIGLSDAKRRECDVVARKVLGGQRASSIFPAPIRPCLRAKDYDTASRICFEHSGRKLNRQSFFLLEKIRQVDDLMTPELQQRVREIHPEISFWALNGKKPMQYKKRKLAGRKERMKLLSVVFPDVEETIAKAHKPKQVAPDDILDALVATWTACQTVMGKAETLPQTPELDSKGLRMEILCPACYNR
jgi:predicted RNase H-like nuclease